MKPVTTIPGETGSTSIIGTQMERAFSFIRVKYSLNQSKDWNNLGYHIGLLIMAALAHIAPQFIREGRLCWLRSPLYIVTSGKTESYFFTDEEFNAAKSKIKGEVKRNKGLGALKPHQAKRSMFDPEYQRMDVMEYEESAMDLLYSLMGEDVAPRREFIMKNVDFTEIRE